jgi:hypothetical protein
MNNTRIIMNFLEILVGLFIIISRLIIYPGSFYPGLGSLFIFVGVFQLVRDYNRNKKKKNEIF